MKIWFKTSLVLAFILGALMLMPAQSTWAGQRAQTLPTAPPPGVSTTLTYSPEKLARWCKYLYENPYRGIGASYRPYSVRLMQLKIACQKLYPDMDY